MGIGYGTNGLAVSKDVEQYEVVTVTAVGKAGAQTALAANARTGDTTIRLRNSTSVSVGDKITLDIDSVGHGIETVTVAAVGAAPPPPASAPAGTGPATTAQAGGGRGGRGGGGRGGPGGGGMVELAAPLKFNHTANMPLSIQGTGISFQPATAFAHISNEPVQPLGSGITLDKPLDNDHDINAAVSDATVTSAGYQGTPKPNQWFGGPVIGNAGNIVLRDAAGLVADSLNYGGLIDPWAAEGYQAASGANRSGCSVPSPNGGGGAAGAVVRAPGPRSCRSDSRWNRHRQQLCRFPRADSHARCAQPGQLNQPRAMHAAIAASARRQR